MVDPEVDINNLDIEKDKELFNAVRACDTFDDALCDVILEHGYTGVIGIDHKEDIIGTMEISIWKCIDSGQSGYEMILTRVSQIICTDRMLLSEEF